MEFFNQLDPLLRTFWYVAIPSSLIFLTQTILAFIGASHGDGSDADFDSHDHAGDGTVFHYFSFRNLINFLLGFGWSGVSLYGTVPNHFLLIIIALSVGVFFVWLFFLLIQQLQRLSEDNSFQLADAVGKLGEVYLKVPAKRTGIGKVQVSIKGSTHELEAVTDGDELRHGEKVAIVAIEEEFLLVRATPKA